MIAADINRNKDNRKRRWEHLGLLHSVQSPQAHTNIVPRVKIRTVLKYDISNSLTNNTATICQALRNITTITRKNLVNIRSYEDVCS